MNGTQTNLKNLLIELQGKKIRLHLTGNITYTTNSLIFLEPDAVSFKDRYNARVMLRLSQILRVEEVKA